MSCWVCRLRCRDGAMGQLVLGRLSGYAGCAFFASPGMGGSKWTTFFPAVLVLGFGMATSVAPLTTTVMNSVDQRHAGVASGVNNAVSRTAGLLGVAILGIVLLHAYNGELDRRLEKLSISPETRKLVDEQRARLAGAELPSSVDHETRTNLKSAINDSFVFSFR